MFGPPGIAFVRYLYGMHYCLNVAVGPPGQASAVLLRAAEITDGLGVARRRRTGPSGRVPRDRDLARGPARLTQALGVTTDHDGLDLAVGDGPLTLTLPSQRASAFMSGPRVGISRATDRPWRYWMPDEPAVSAYRGGRRAGGGRRAQE